MDKLINELERIVSFYRYDGTFAESFTDEEISKFLAHDEVASSLSAALKRYKVRSQSCSNKEISSVQFEQIKCMVGCADYRKSLIPHLPEGCQTISFFRGYISAVSRLMEILDLDDTCLDKLEK